MSKINSTSIYQSIRKLISRLKVTDYIVLTLVVVVLLVLILVFSRNNTTFYVTMQLSPEYVRDDVSPPQYWLAKNIEVGDLSYDGTGRKVAKVLEVINTDYGGIQRQIDIVLEVYGMYDKRTKQFRVNDTVFTVGKNTTFVVSNTNIDGVITDISPSLESLRGEQHTKEVVLLMRDVDPLVAGSYSNDFIAKDSNGETIFSVTNSKILPAKKTAITDEGIIRCAIDPNARDVLIFASIQVNCFQEVCYYLKRMPLKWGYNLWVQTSNNFLNAKIVGFNISDYEKILAGHSCE